MRSLTIFVRLLRNYMLNFADWRRMNLTNNKKAVHAFQPDMSNEKLKKSNSIGGNSYSFPKIKTLKLYPI